mgnify:CR=1 FL=1
MQKQQEMPMKTPSKRRFLGPCSLIFTAANTGTWRAVRPDVDAAVCIRCGTCKRVCPVDCVTIHKEGEKPVEFDWRYCKGCGICANECPKQCIALIDERSAQ